MGFNCKGCVIERERVCVKTQAIEDKRVFAGTSQLRLCLVHVKYFPENIYFSEMLFSGKENIFQCLVTFQNIF